VCVCVGVCVCEREREREREREKERERVSVSVCVCIQLGSRLSSQFLTHPSKPSSYLFKHMCFLCPEIGIKAVLCGHRLEIV
jgi:hypothetical protein